MVGVKGVLLYDSSVDGMLKFFSSSMGQNRQWKIRKELEYSRVGCQDSLMTMTLEKNFKVTHYRNFLFFREENGRSEGCAIIRFECRQDAEVFFKFHGSKKISHNG